MIFDNLRVTSKITKSVYRVDQCPVFHPLLVVFTNNVIVLFFSSHVDDTTNVPVLTQ